MPNSYFDFVGQFGSYANSFPITAGWARDERDSGVSPPGAEDADIYRGARSGYFVSDDKSPWREVYARQLAASVRPPSTPLRAAE